MNAGKREYAIATMVRAGVAALLVVGILFVGATAPSQDGGAVGAHAATVAGNGPTGYFPDMFVNQGTGGEPQPEAF